MSHPLTTGVGARSATESETEITDTRTIQRLLDALEDDGCRAILEATSDEALSAQELADTCGLALSTTYRKVEQLAETGLLEKRVRIARSGKHTSEYLLGVGDVHVSLDGEEGVELQVSRRESASPVTPAFAGAD